MESFIFQERESWYEQKPEAMDTTNSADEQYHSNLPGVTDVHPG